MIDLILSPTRTSDSNLQALANAITLKNLIRKGIPAVLRPKVWFSLSGAAKKKSTVTESYYNDLIKAVDSKITPATRQIDQCSFVRMWRIARQKLGAGGFPVPFQALRAMVQANPQILQPMLQELGKQNPHLMRLIQEHQADFVRLINEPVEGGEGNVLGQLAAAMPQSVTVTPEEREVIERLYTGSLLYR
ncbi:unnamed protein product [Camellia sinensis]